MRSAKPSVSAGRSKASRPTQMPLTRIARRSTISRSSSMIPRRRPFPTATMASRHSLTRSKKKRTNSTRIVRSCSTSEMSCRIKSILSSESGANRPRNSARPMTGSMRNSTRIGRGVRSVRAHSGRPRMRRGERRARCSCGRRRLSPHSRCRSRTAKR